jgi:hypothetical protein
MAAAPLFMGGVFNYVDPLFGLQLYIWGWIALLVLAVVSWLAWRYGQWEPYKPVWGLFYAFKAESQAAFIFNIGLVCELLSERDAKCIFNYAKWDYRGINAIQKWVFNYATVFLPDLPKAKAILYKYGGRNLDVEIAKKMQNHEWEKHSSVTLGGIHTDMILDGDNWTVKDSPQHKIIEAQCEVHNDGNESDQIHSYSKYMRYLLERKMPCPDGVKMFITVPWSRIDSAFPCYVPNNTMSGAKRQYARELEELDNNSLSKYYFPILGGGLGFAALLLICRMAMKFIM